ncbi:MAG: hypothetical protein JXM69_03850 [Anaerolineae bacterium]|nr:hypothetical protein [Anaerolineae bacterium]
MTRQILYQECPLCNRGTVAWNEAESAYRCGQCGLTLKERAVLDLFRKGRLGVSYFGEGDYSLARQSLNKVALPPDLLKVTLGNVYPDPQLAELAAGSLEIIRPVRTVLAQIILEQLNEKCFLQVNGLRRGHGQPLDDGGSYQPVNPVRRQGIEWQDAGNLFCTNQRLVFPSNRFTFIRLDRKLVGARAFADGVAVQRTGEEFATYFVGCYPHEAALVAAYVMAKVPKLQITPAET